MIKRLKVRGSRCNLVIVYNNVGIDKLKGSLRKVCEGLEESESLLVIGDMNARIEEKQIDEGRDKLEKKRKSENKTLNREGNKIFIELGEKLGV